MRSVRSHSTTEREKEGKKEGMRHMTKRSVRADMCEVQQSSIPDLKNTEEFRLR